jgi:hypothetical protein
LIFFAVAGLIRFNLFNLKKRKQYEIDS